MPIKPWSALIILERPVCLSLNSLLKSLVGVGREPHVQSWEIKNSPQVNVIHSSWQELSFIFIWGFGGQISLDTKGTLDTEEQTLASSIEHMCQPWSYFSSQESCFAYVYVCICVCMYDHYWLCSGIIPGELGPYILLGIKPELVVYKASVLPRAHY